MTKAKAKKKKTAATKKPSTIRYELPVGDWSNDGHGKVDWFVLESQAATMEAVREAFFKARTKVPADLHPEVICAEYEDDRVTPTVRRAVAKVYGVKITAVDDVTAEDMAEITAKFITIGGVPTSVIPDDLPMLPFFGVDKKKRCIEFIGYGLFT